jgi:hypothetical protein
MFYDHDRRKSAKAGLRAGTATPKISDLIDVCCGETYSPAPCTIRLGDLPIRGFDRWLAEQARKGECAYEHRKFNASSTKRSDTLTIGVGTFTVWWRLMTTWGQKTERFLSPALRSCHRKHRLPFPKGLSLDDRIIIKGTPKLRSTSNAVGR